MTGYFAFFADSSPLFNFQHHPSFRILKTDDVPAFSSLVGYVFPEAISPSWKGRWWRSNIEFRSRKALSLFPCCAGRFVTREVVWILSSSMGRSHWNLGIFQAFFVVRYPCQLKRIFFLNWGWFSQKPHRCWTFWSCWSCFMLYQVIAALRICCRVSGTSCRGNDLITSVSILEMHVSRNLVNPQIPQLVKFFESRKNI